MTIPNALTMRQFLGLDKQIVFSNSPAEGQLQRGDIIDAIGIRRGVDLSHKQAQDSLKHGGGQIELQITRPPTGRVNISSAPPNITPVNTRAPQQIFDPYPEQKPQMPQQRSYGHQPKKVTVSKYGGGGPSFGAEYGGTPASMQSQGGSYRPVEQYNMLNRVQGSLDNIILSPRTPEASPSQAPFYQTYEPNAPQPQSTPIYQYQPPHSESTGERLDRMKEQQGDYPDHFDPAKQQPHPSAMFPGYRSTSERLAQIPAEDEENQIPVRDRRQAFLGPSSLTHAAKPIKPKRPSPKFKKQTGPVIGTDYTKLGVDYSQLYASRPSSDVWQPPPPQQHHHHQIDINRQPDATSLIHTPYEDGEPTVPAWRHTLKTSGVKPWDEDLEYGSRNPPPEVHESPRLVSNDPVPNPQQTVSSNNDFGHDDNLNVVHLQYNSPMGLYSNDKVQETIDGQTRLKAAQHSSKQPSMQPMQPIKVTQKQPGSQKAPMVSGERDWSQSAVFRMVALEQDPGASSHQREGGHRPPPPPPKPSAQPAQFHQHQFQTPYDDEVGVSDF